MELNRDRPHEIAICRYSKLSRKKNKSNDILIVNDREPISQSTSHSEIIGSKVEEIQQNVAEMVFCFLREMFSLAKRFFKKSVVLAS